MWLQGFSYKYSHKSSKYFPFRDLNKPSNGKHREPKCVGVYNGIVCFQREKELDMKGERRKRVEQPQLRKTPEWFDRIVANSGDASADVNCGV